MASSPGAKTVTKNEIKSLLLFLLFIPNRFLITCIPGILIAGYCGDKGVEFEPNKNVEKKITLIKGLMFNDYCLKLNCKILNEQLF